MADQNKTLEEELAERGIVASYVWKPNLLYARQGSEYIPVDTISDADVHHIQDELEAAGRQNLASIQAACAGHIADLDQTESSYTNVRDNLILTYTRMKEYFERHGIISLSTVMNTAIANLRAL